MKRTLASVISLFVLRCSPAVATIPPPNNAPETPAKDFIHVQWIKVRDGNDFWQTIKQNNKNVALIGTEICPPCQSVKEWWERHVAPVGWQFVYWRVNSSDDLLTKSFKDIFRRMQDKDYLLLPYLSIIEDSRDRYKMKTITATFNSYDGCTGKANRFLLMHPQGTIRF